MFFLFRLHSLASRSYWKLCKVTTQSHVKINRIYLDVTLQWRHSDVVVTQIIVTSTVCPAACTSKETSKHRTTRPYVRAIHWSPMDSIVKGQWRRNRFHVMTSACKEVFANMMAFMAEHKTNWSCLDKLTTHTRNEAHGINLINGYQVRCPVNDICECLCIVVCMPPWPYMYLSYTGWLGSQILSIW